MEAQVSGGCSAVALGLGGARSLSEHSTWSRDSWPHRLWRLTWYPLTWCPCALRTESKGACQRQQYTGSGKREQARRRSLSHVLNASSRGGSNNRKNSSPNPLPDSRQPGDVSGSSGEEAFDDRIRALKSSGSPQNTPETAAEVGRKQTLPPEEGSNPWVKIIAGAAAIAIVGSIVVGNLVPQDAGFSRGQSPSAQQVQVDSEEAKQLRQQGLAFEEVLRKSSSDVDALESAGVIYATLGEYDKAADYLEKLVKARPQYVEALRLLAEVKFEAKDYSRAAYMYRRAIKASPEESLSLVKALADTLISNNAPNEAVDEILKARDRIRKSNAAAVAEQNGAAGSRQPGAADAGVAGADSLEDEVPVDLLLAQAYQYCDKPDKAFAVYDNIVANHPEDFRPYLAKGILLRQQKREVEAQQVLEQARLLVPEAANQLVTGQAASSD